MPYGQAGRLGESIDPSLGRMDFSGFERAGAIKGAGFKDIGNQIGEAIKLKQKEKKLIDNQKEYLREYGKQAKQYFPDIAQQIDAALTMMDDPSMNAQQQLGVGKGMVDALGLYQQKQEMDFRKAALAARSAAGKQPPGIKIGPIQEYTMPDGSKKQLQVVSVNGQDTLMTAEETLKLSRGTQAGLGISSLIDLGKEDWRGVPFKDPSYEVQSELGVPMEGAMGVVPAPKDKDATARLQKTTTFIDGAEVEATFDPTTGQTAPIIGSDGKPVVVPSSTRESSMQERYNMLKKALYVREGREPTPEEDAQFLEQAANFNALKPMINEAVRGLKGDL